MINIAELLRNAPKGFKLYSPLFGEVEFSKINSVNAVEVIVTCTDGTQGIERFHSNGTYISRCPNAECLIFPSKVRRTWEGWKLPIEPKFKVGDWVVFNNNHNSIYQIREIKDSYYRLIHTHGGSMPLSFSQGEFLRPWTIEDVKDGDVLVTTKIRNCPFIYRKTSRNNGLAYYYAGVDGDGNFCEGCLKRTLYHFGSVENVVPATKEQRDLLFAKMREAGYEWDADKKELRKIQSHYDIANFKPKQWVLVRQGEGCAWRLDVFSHLKEGSVCQFECVGNSMVQCIPFEGNEHLLGTADQCDERFINW